MSASPGQQPRFTNRRRGISTIFLLVTLSLLLVVVALVVDLGNHWVATVELCATVDMTDVSATMTLVDDYLLSADARRVLRRLIEEAQQQAVRYATANPVKGEPLVLDPDHDIRFGFYTTAGGVGSFQTFEETGLTWVDINRPDLIARFPYGAVRVTGRRTERRGTPVGMMFSRAFGFPSMDAVKSATAILDRDVIGFRSQAGVNVPLAPIAIRAGVRGADDNDHSWEYQVRHGPDEWFYQRETRSYVPGSDGIREVVVRIPLGVPALANAALLKIGAGPDWWDTIARQTAMGITDTDLSAYGGRLVLGLGDELDLPGCIVGPGPGSSDLDKLQGALESLRQSGAARPWPLFAGFEPDDPGPLGMVRIVGFAAARVIGVSVAPAGPGAGPHLRIVLQPAMMTAGSAITDAARRQQNPNLYNRYLVKVRLVE